MSKNLDATSPKINDLLKYAKLVELLETFGFELIKCIALNCHLHVENTKTAQSV